MNLSNTMSNSDDNIKKIIHLMQTDDSVDAPADAIKWSKNIFRTPVVERKKSIFKSVLGVLQVNLKPNKPVFGERSASASKVRQMLFDAGENSVDIRITEDENGYDLHAQILGVGFENASVHFGSHETVANELSEFKFAGIKKGTYEVRIRNLDSEIILEKVRLD